MKKKQPDSFVPVRDGVELKLCFSADTGFFRLSHPYGSEWTFNENGQIIRMSKACCGMGAADAVEIEYNTDAQIKKSNQPRRSVGRVWFQ